MIIRNRTTQDYTYYSDTHRIAVCTRVRVRGTCVVHVVYTLKLGLDIGYRSKNMANQETRLAAPVTGPVPLGV